MPDLPFIVDTKATSVAPGSAGLIVPPEQTFLTRFNMPWDTWPRWFDEAVLDNPTNAIRMRFDPVLTTPMDVLVRAVVLQTWHIEPDDDTNEDEVTAAAEVEWRIRRLPHLTQFLTTLLWDGIWCGRSAAQVYYKWNSRKGVNGLAPFGYDPVNGDKIVFGFGKNRGRVGVRVWSGYQGKSELTDWGFVRWFDDKERANLVVHRHNREDQDYTQWMKSGAIEGVGIRDRLYWTWTLKNQVMAYLADYLQWFSRGLTIFYYEAHNTEALIECQTRVQEHTKSGLPVMLFPRVKDGGPGYKPVERVEPGTAGNSMIFNLATGYFDDLFRRSILGQDATTVSSGVQSLGDGSADLHQTTFDSLCRWNSDNFGESLSSDLVAVIYAYSYPGMNPGKWRWENDAVNVSELLESVKSYIELGGQVDGDLLRKDLGIPPITPGSQILGGPAPMQPSAVNQLPDSVPAITPPGAAPQQTGPLN
jgi:hypothetical protein